MWEAQLFLEQNLMRARQRQRLTDKQRQTEEDR